MAKQPLKQAAFKLFSHHSGAYEAKSTLQKRPLDLTENKNSFKNQPDKLRKYQLCILALSLQNSFLLFFCRISPKRRPEFK